MRDREKRARKARVKAAQNPPYALPPIGYHGGVRGQNAGASGGQIMWERAPREPALSEAEGFSRAQRGVSVHSPELAPVLATPQFRLLRKTANCRATFTPSPASTERRNHLAARS